MDDHHTVDVTGALRCTQARLHAATWPRLVDLSALVAAALCKRRLESMGGRIGPGGEPGLGLHLLVQAAARRVAGRGRPGGSLTARGGTALGRREDRALQRAGESTRHVPVVAVSANAMPVDTEATRAAGFLAYLTKPIHLETLLGTVRDVLGSTPLP